MTKMTTTEILTGIKNWVLGKVGNITALIPSQATSSNQLADKAFVNSSIATATATFRGTYNVVSDLSLAYNATHAQIEAALATKMTALSIAPDNNDYAFVQIPTSATSTDIAKVEKYKFNGTAWAFEYELNNSGFTAAQWAAINSGATLELIGKLSALPTNAQLTTLLAGKQNVLTFDDVPTQNSDNPAKSGGIYSAIATAITNATNAIKEWANGLFAKTNGWYKQLTAGLAENLVSPDGVTNTEPYIFRTSAGSSSISNGYAQLKKIEGRTVKFNQLQVAPTRIEDFYLNDILSVSFSNGIISGTAKAENANINTYPLRISTKGNHKYYISVMLKTASQTTNIEARFGASGNETTVACASTTSWQRVSFFCSYPTDRNNARFTIRDTRTSNWDAMQATGFVIIDLTDIFGAGNEPSTVEEFESWLATNIGLKSYYPYSAGKLVSVDIDGLETTGFNQWDEEWENGTIDVTTGQPKTSASAQIRSKNYNKAIGGITYYAANLSNYYVRMFFYDSEKEFISSEATSTGLGGTITAPANAAYFKIIAGGGYGNVYKNDICVNFSWSGYRDGEYEAYWKEKRDLSWIKSLKDTNNNTLFPYGLLSAGSVKDEVTGSKAIKRIGVVDLGTLAGWTYSSSGSDTRFYTTQVTNMKAVNADVKANAICSKYDTYSRAELNNVANGISLHISSSTYYVNTKDTSLAQSDIDSQGKISKLNGVMLYYELATPIEVDIDPEANMNYKVDDWGTEEFTSDSQDVPQTVAPYHTTHYMDNLRDKLRNIDTNFVSATEEQAFTDAQKAQARGNIGAGTVNPNDDCPNLVAGLAKNLLDVNGVGSEQEFVYRATGGGAAISGNGNVTIKKFKGKSIVWNQYVYNNTGSITANGITFTRNSSNGSLTIEGTATAYAYNNMGNISTKQNHMYYLATSAKEPSKINFSTYSETGLSLQGIASGIFMASTSLTTAIGVFITNGTTVNDVLYPQIIDLTLMFGAGNEPSTVAEFEALFPNSYYAYNAGTIINNEVKQVETTGRNQWDEEWEKGGISTKTGQNQSDLNRFRSKNYISVIPNATYYIKVPSYIYFFAYDIDKNFIGNIVTSNAGQSGTMEIPSNVRYLRFQSYNIGTTYNHDICINLSDASFNGTYEPYSKNTIAINLDSFDVKDAQGNVITVNGLKSAGNVFDEIDPVRKKYIKRVGTVDLGTLTSWVYRSNLSVFSLSNSSERIFVNNSKVVCSKYASTDATSIGNMVDKSIGCINGFNENDLIVKDTSYSDATVFTSAMSGVIVNYVLRTPVEYDLVDNIVNTYHTPAGGTEGIVPQGVNESGVPATAPFRGTNLYSKDYVQTINNLPVDFDATASIDALASALATTLSTALNGTLTITRGSYDSTNKKYSWTVNFTANA